MLDMAVSRMDNAVERQGIDVITTYSMNIRILTFQPST